MKIICVDDEKLILDLTVNMCQNLPQKPDVIGFQKGTDALEHIKSHSADIALLDINLSDMNGLRLAARIKEFRPDTKIIFLTGYSEYAVDAIAMHASGYLMKPVSTERLQAEIDYAAQSIAQRTEKQQSSHIFVQTFGQFDVFVEGKAVAFSRSRSKELLAYLVDKRGGIVSRSAAFSALWENRQYDRPMQKQFDVILRSLRQTLNDNGIGNILEMSRNGIRIVPELIDCDLYRFYDGDPKTVNSYRGEYMNDYSWANFTEAGLITAQ